jgi:hypothetical protein
MENDGEFTRHRDRGIWSLYGLACVIFDGAMLVKLRIFFVVILSAVPQSQFSGGEKARSDGEQLRARYRVVRCRQSC